MKKNNRPKSVKNDSTNIGIPNKLLISTAPKKSIPDRLLVNNPDEINKDSLGENNSPSSNKSFHESVFRFTELTTNSSKPKSTMVDGYTVVKNKRKYKRRSVCILGTC